jgi:hypothetical protein
MGGAGQFDVPGPGNDFVPPQELVGISAQFQFVHGQLAPIATTGLPRSQRPRMPRAQSMPHHTDPSQAHLPLQEAFRPPPGFPQHPLNPGHTFYPGVEQPRPQAENIRPTGRQSRPRRVTPRRSGYQFDPARGFICHVCSTCVARPGVHRFEAQRSFCSAGWSEVREDHESDIQRMPEVSNTKL